jgi:hypothetical protein
VIATESVIAEAEKLKRMANLFEVEANTGIYSDSVRRGLMDNAQECRAEARALLGIDTSVYGYDARGVWHEPNVETPADPAQGWRGSWSTSTMPDQPNPWQKLRPLPAETKRSIWRAIVRFFCGK